MFLYNITLPIYLYNLQIQKKDLNLHLVECWEVGSSRQRPCTPLLDGSKLWSGHIKAPLYTSPCFTGGGTDEYTWRKLLITSLQPVNSITINLNVEHCFPSTCYCRFRNVKCSLDNCRNKTRYVTAFINLKSNFQVNKQRHSFAYNMNICLQNKLLVCMTRIERARQLLYHCHQATDQYSRINQSTVLTSCNTNRSSQ